MKAKLFRSIEIAEVKKVLGEADIDEIARHLLVDGFEQVKSGTKLTFSPLSGNDFG